MLNKKLIIIAAVSIDGVIGVDDKIPWHISEDFQHFKNTTIGNIVIVGYNTYLTLPEKAFENREYIVIGDHPIKEHKYKHKIYQFKELDTILYLINNDNDFEKVFIAGGAMVYESLMDYCDEAIITWVDKTYPDGNKRFPVDKLFYNFMIYGTQNWQISKSGLSYAITTYKRITPKETFMRNDKTENNQI